ncbi:MAG: SDR family oxidoreductase [Pseudomonadales bacterium]|nr:SDR family oxidoreductase [Pseudomonadales bacterium]NIX09036.1 SDR family oxidoreductase [Pseudomonadales bacterium]
MNDRPVVVTGGAGGIGSAIVARLVEDGHPVAVLDLHPAAAPTAGAPGSVFSYPCDIADLDAVEQAVAEFEAEAGVPFGLVNNAGWDQALPFLETGPDLWEKVIDVNLRGPVNVTHAVLRRLAEAGRGRVVSIASDAGRVGSSGEAVYSACKGGIIAFMKTLAREHARQGITFNSVCPGPTDTPLLDSFDESGRLAEALERAIPMRRLGRPEDFPGLVAFLLSDEASFITGQTVSVSGGLSMQG